MIAPPKVAGELTLRGRTDHLRGVGAWRRRREAEGAHRPARISRQGALSGGLPMRVPSAGRRSAVLAAALACAVTVSVHARPQAEAGPTPVRYAAGLDDAGYLALADRLQRRLDPLWNEAMGRYE